MSYSVESVQQCCRKRHHSFPSLPYRGVPIGRITVCEGLGYEGKAAEIRKGDALTFSFGNLKTDSVEVDIRLLPNHPVQDDKLRFSVSLDGAEPEVVAYETKGRSEEWKENVLRNQAIRKIVLPVTGKKYLRERSEGSLLSCTVRGDSSSLCLPLGHYKHLPLAGAFQQRIFSFNSHYSSSVPNICWKQSALYD